MGVYDRTYQAAMVDDDGSGTTGTIYNKAAINSIVTDLEKGHFITDGDTYPFAIWDGTVPGLMVGVGASTDLDVLWKFDGSGQTSFRNKADTGYTNVVMGALSTYAGATIRRDGSETNSPNQVAVFEGQTSGAAAAGYGVRQRIDIENDNGDSEVAAYMDFVWTDASDGSEDADWVLKLMAGGSAAAEKFRVSSAGEARASSAIAIGAAPAATGRVRLTNTGTIKARNAADDGDVEILSVNASDLIAFGPDRTAVGTAGNFSADFYIRFQDGSGDEFYVAAMNAAW